MLSTKVICAIQILRELALHKDMAEQSGLRAAELKEKGTMQDMFYPKILVKLREKGYVKQAGDRYRLSVDLATVTLKDMVETFHGGVVIGETFAIPSNKVYRYMSQYRKLAATEKEIEGKIIKDLHLINLAQLFFRTGGNSIESD